jgi:hypothetical protein
MWMMIVKVALLGFLVLGCGVFVITYIRKARRGGRPRQSNPYAAGYLNSVRGGVPPTPLPEWVDWPGASDDQTGR